MGKNQWISLDRASMAIENTTKNELMIQWGQANDLSPESTGETTNGVHNNMFMVEKKTQVQ